MARDNRMLGVFQLIGIPPAPRGIPQIEVTFDIDANGIMNVTAKDKATNNEQKITITSSSGLSKEEVEKMARDAESHRPKISKRKDEIDARNRADSMVYQVEKMLKDHRDKISDADAKQVEDGARIDAQDHGGRQRRGTQQGGRRADAGQPQTGRGDVQDGQLHAGPTPGGDGRARCSDGAGSAKEKREGNVVDAEFVDVEDKKK